MKILLLLSALILALLAAAGAQVSPHSCCIFFTSTGFPIIRCE